MSSPHNSFLKEAAPAAECPHAQERAAANIASDLEALKAEIAKGLASGPGLPAQEVFDRLKAKR